MHSIDDQDGLSGNGSVNKDLCDVQLLRDWCNRDAALLDDVVCVFQQVFAATLPQLRDAVARADAQRLLERSHHLAGSASNFQAPAILRAALHLQHIARSGQIDLASAAIDRLEFEYDRLALVFVAILGASRRT